MSVSLIVVNCVNWSGCGIRGAGCCAIGTDARDDDKPPKRPGNGYCRKCTKFEEKIPGKPRVIELPVLKNSPGIAPPASRGLAPLQPQSAFRARHRSLWTEQQRELAADFRDGDRGLGDVVERNFSQKRGWWAALSEVSARFGALSTLAGAILNVMGMDCGCADKKERLNTMLPRGEWMKPRPKLVIWTYADGDCVWMANGLARSLKEQKIPSEFHVWSPNDVPEADYCHFYRVPAGSAERRYFTFKFDILREAAKIEADYFLFLDADTICLRDPGDLLRCMGGDPVHAFLEAGLEDDRRRKWWEVSCGEMADAMRECGLEGACYGVNAGAFIIAREAVGKFVDLAEAFRTHLHGKTGVWVTEEPALAFAAAKMAREASLHQDIHWHDLWGVDWTGEFKGRLPDGKPWKWRNYLRENKVSTINPAIVHAMRSKEALAKNGAAGR